MIDDCKGSKGIGLLVAGPLAWGALTLVLLFSSLASACRGREHRTPSDTLVVVVDAVLRDLDPRFAITNHDVKLSRLVAPGLTTADSADLSPRLLLAESITELDELHVRVRLKPGLRFSDGTPLRAEDVAYTYSSVLDPETGSLYRKSFSERFSRVEVTSELEVDFELREPIATLYSDLEFGIISKAQALAGGGSFKGGRVVGAGAYRIVSFSPERVVLERSEHYPVAAEAVPKIEVKTVRDGNARNLMLAGGSADFCQNGVRVDLVDEMSKRERVRVESGPSAILTYLMMHNEDPVLADVRVRRAIAHAIDRRRIVEAKYGGRARLATGLLPTFHWAYRADVPNYDYDPEEAMRLLDEAGYPDPDGPGGTPRLRLSYKTSASQFRLAVARVIAAQLEEVGIAIDVQSFEFGTFFSDIKAGNYQLGSMQTSAISEPDFFYTYFHSERIPTAETPHTHNRWRYRNAELDELTLRGRRTLDQEERKLLYGRVQELLAEELPIIPLWHEDNIVVMNKSVSGFTIYPNARVGGLAETTKR